MPPQRRDAEFAALLHDIGKIKVPGEIINKPGKLTGRRVGDHRRPITLEGERLLCAGRRNPRQRRPNRSFLPRGLGRNRLPDALVGEEIPLVARIVRACDAFSAMTTDRSYRKARPVEEARR